jgi:hypothetical protein
VDVGDTRAASHAFDGIAQLVRRPILEFTQLVRRVKEATEDMRRHLREIATLVMRVLDGVSLQMTRMRARSEVEVVYGPLLVSITSGVILAKERNGIAASAGQGVVWPEHSFLGGGSEFLPR